MTRVALALAALLVCSSAHGADVAVDLELVLAVDVSRSMDRDELSLQRDGYVSAIQHPDVVSAIGQGLHGRIALTYVEWAGIDSQFTVVDWRLVDGPSAARSFSSDLAAAPIQRYRGTSISNSLTFVASRFDRNGFEGLRHVIDVSGDGPNNTGMPVEAARDQALAAGITINGLPIMIKRAGGFASIANLDVYYEDCVIGGPGAFLIVVRSADHLADAIRRKLVLEIAGRQPGYMTAATSANQKRVDCQIGEKLRQQWLRE